MASKKKMQWIYQKIQVEQNRDSIGPTSVQNRYRSNQKWYLDQSIKLWESTRNNPKIDTWIYQKTMKISPKCIREGPFGRPGVFPPGFCEAFAFRTGIGSYCAWALNSHVFWIFSSDRLTQRRPGRGAPYLLKAARGRITAAPGNFALGGGIS